MSACSCCPGWSDFRRRGSDHCYLHTALPNCACPVISQLPCPQVTVVAGNTPSEYNLSGTSLGIDQVNIAEEYGTSSDSKSCSILPTVIYYLQLVGLSGATAEQIGTTNDLIRKSDVPHSGPPPAIQGVRFAVCLCSPHRFDSIIQESSHSQERSVGRKAYNPSRNSVMNQFLARNY